MTDDSGIISLICRHCYEGVQEQGAEENIWTKELRSASRLEKTALWVAL